MSKFCPECGTPTVIREDGNLPRDVCPNCGWVHYPTHAIGVGALVLHGDAALLVERGIPPVGRWTLPSGWIEQDDNLYGAIIREVKEETALDVTPQGVICVRNIPRQKRNDLYVVFLCEADPAQDPVPDGSESTQARFVSPAEFDQIDISWFTRLIIEQYVRHHPQPWPLNTLTGYGDKAIFFAPF